MHAEAVAVRPATADRADDFERFITEVVPYAFMFEGGSLTEDWDLDVVLPAHYGDEQTDRPSWSVGRGCRIRGSRIQPSRVHVGARHARVRTG